MNPSKPNDFLNTFPSDSPDESLPDSALIQTALCYLMTRYALHPCPGLVYTIMHHLQMLSSHPDMVGAPEQRQTHGELLQRWKQIDKHWRASCREKDPHQEHYPGRGRPLIRRGQMGWERRQN